jgi:hypothetical protein
VLSPSNTLTELAAKQEFSRLSQPIGELGQKSIGPTIREG